MITRAKKREFIEDIKKANWYEGPMTGFSECAKCGQCCLKNACACVPEDFDDLSVKGIEKILDSGKYMICAFYGNASMPNGIPIEALPVITAREVGCPDNGIYITMLHSKCAMLGPNGCKLSEDERPSQGLLLIPDGKGCKCYLDAPTDFWREHWNALDEVIKKRTGKTCQELFEEELRPLATSIKRAIQMAVLYGGSISYQEFMTAEAMKRLGVFYGLFGKKLGEVMDDFIDWVDVRPVK